MVIVTTIFASSQPRRRRVPPVALWVACVTIVPLASFGTATLMVQLNHGHPISEPWHTLFQAVGIFFEFAAPSVIAGAFARRPGLGWIRVVLVACLAFVALIAWVWGIYSILTWSGVQMFPPD